MEGEWRVSVSGGQGSGFRVQEVEAKFGFSVSFTQRQTLNKGFNLFFYRTSSLIHLNIVLCVNYRLQWFLLNHDVKLILIASFISSNCNSPWNHFLDTGLFT